MAEGDVAQECAAHPRALAELTCLLGTQYDSLEYSRVTGTERRATAQHADQRRGSRRPAAPGAETEFRATGIRKANQWTAKVRSRLLNRLCRQGRTTRFRERAVRDVQVVIEQDHPFYKLFRITVGDDTCRIAIGRQFVDDYHALWRWYFCDKSGFTGGWPVAHGNAPRPEDELPPARWPNWERALEDALNEITNQPPGWGRKQPYE